jgi:hypothetical protein
LSGFVAPIAFAGFIYTLLMQRNELALQRRELQQAREIWDAQRSEQAQSNLHARKTSFCRMWNAGKAHYGNSFEN